MFLTFLWVILFWPVFFICNYLLYLTGDSILEYSGLAIGIWTLGAFFLYDLK